VKLIHAVSKTGAVDKYLSKFFNVKVLTGDDIFLNDIIKNEKIEK